MSYQISKRFSAVVPIAATLLPLRTCPTMGGRTTVKTCHASQTHLEQPERTLHGHHGPTHPTAGQANHWAAKTTAYQTKCWQQHNDPLLGHATTEVTTTPHIRQENEVGDSLQWPNAARRAHTGHLVTPDEPATGGHDNGAPTPRAGHAPVVTQPPHPTGRPPQTREQTEKTTKTTSGYTGAGCSAAHPTTHKPTIRRLTQPGTEQTGCRKNDPTVNRPHASRQTPNQPGMQGSKREGRPMGWQHHDVPRPLANMPMNAPQRRHSTTKRPTDQPRRPLLNPRPQDNNDSP